LWSVKGGSMDIQLTEKEQKIYDNLVKCSSGEYRDTKYDVAISGLGRMFSDGEFDAYFYWWANTGCERIFSDGSDSESIENWRDKVKDDLLEEFIYEYRLGTLKKIDNMVEFSDWKNKFSNVSCTETHADGNAFYSEIEKWGGGQKEKVKVLVNVNDYNEYIEDNATWNRLVNSVGTVNIQFSALDGEFNIEVDIYNLLIHSIQYSNSDGSKGNSHEQHVYATFNFLDAVGFYEKYLNVDMFDEFLEKLKCIKGAEINYGSSGLFDLLSKLYIGMQRYGSPENYLKQIAASRECSAHAELAHLGPS
jgi:hypothetical protein